MTYLYLAGDIALATSEETESWRKDVTEHFRWSSPRITCLNPLRGERKPAPGEKYGYDSGGHFGEIFTKNWFDITRSDLILAVMLAKSHPSIGTLSEINWAWVLKKPVVLVTHDNRVSNHPLIRHMVPTIYLDLWEAVRYIDMLVQE